WDAHGAVLAGAITGARVVRLAAAHVSSLELPRTFARAVLEFLTPRSSDAAVAGIDLRRHVLGRDHVERSMASATDLTRDYQDMVNRHVWGDIWSRPGL